MRRTLTATILVAGGLLVVATARAVEGRAAQHSEPPELAGPVGRSEALPSNPKSTPERSKVMSTRYLTNVVLGLAAGFVIVATQVFAPHVTAWLAFGITGVGVLAMMGATALLRSRGYVQRVLDGMVAVLAAWTIVESLVFQGTVMTWLTFSAACGMLVLAVCGLTIHELSTERVVHTLEDVRDRNRAEALA